MKWMYLHREPKIYSTLPGGNKYGNLDGTSFSAPIVSGVGRIDTGILPQPNTGAGKILYWKSAEHPQVKGRNRIR